MKVKGTEIRWGGNQTIDQQTVTKHTTLTLTKLLHIPTCYHCAKISELTSRGALNQKEKVKRQHRFNNRPSMTKWKSHFNNIIPIVSSKSSRSHSILLREFRNSVWVFCGSSFENVTPSLRTSLQRRYSPRVLSRALFTSLKQKKTINKLTNKIDKQANKRAHEVIIAHKHTQNNERLTL